MLKNGPNAFFFGRMLCSSHPILGIVEAPQKSGVSCKCQEREKRKELSRTITVTVSRVREQSLGRTRDCDTTLSSQGKYLLTCGDASQSSCDTTFLLSVYPHSLFGVKSNGQMFSMPPVNRLLQSRNSVGRYRCWTLCHFFHPRVIELAT
ncbi:hypothetical protein LZ30DRAFT_425766 [Colletotrichum cereale]|nr:hypothetical protein LZ30DRAFT_425766 [Colletotrichum cereale]